MSGLTLFGFEQQERTSDDYYTPKWVFDRLGLRFDLDVCAPPGGGPFVPCDRYYTMADDGLTSEWFGRVWMNPPYSDASPWAARFIRHRHGIALVQVSKSGWFFDLWHAADAVCGVGPETSKFVGGPIFMPTMFVAFGAECVDALRNLGTVRVAA